MSGVGAYVGAIHVGIGHNNDLVVTRFGRVKGAVAFMIADTVPTAVMRVRISLLPSAFVEAGFFYI